MRIAVRVQKKRKMSKIIHLNNDDFDQFVGSSELPVLVDFWAPWCGPCKAINPIVEKLAEEWEGRAKVCKVDIDDAPNIAAKYNVRGVPTLILFKGGTPTATHVGMTSKDKLNKLLET